MAQEYVVSARKYRPDTFKNVVGQKALVQTLKNAIASGKLAHAYLFCGPRGVGKTTCARIFAKTINCENPTVEGEACNECESCRAMNEQRSYNIHELDAASNNSVDHIRELIDQVQVPPQIGKYKVFIIDEVHMLTTAAFNAFLKTLEEPPAHAIFVMATTEKQKILPTILSRCQIFDFQRIQLQDIVDQLTYIASQEHIATEPQALLTIARKADGGMRDALSLFDQIVSFTAGRVTYQAAIENLNTLDYEIFFRLTNAALENNIPAALMILDQVIRRGFDPQYFIGGWASHLRDLLVSRDAATLSLIEGGIELAQQYQAQAVRCQAPFLYQALQIANECDFNYRNSRNKRLSVEIAIIRVCQLCAPQTPAPSVGQTPLQPAQRPVATTAQPAQATSGTGTGTGPTQTVRTTPPAPTVPTTPRPQPQPAVQQPAVKSPPTQGPAPQPRMGVRPTGTGMGGSRTTSIHAVNRPQGTTEQREEALPEMNETIDDDSLRRVWKNFTTTIPSEKLIVNLMLEYLPQAIGPAHYKVQLSSEEQVGRMQSYASQILRYLHLNLKNTHIRIDYEVLQGQQTARAVTMREKFEEMRQENPNGINHLIDTFKLEFS